MAPTVVITGDYTLLDPKVVQGVTFWGWSFPVVVDGQAGVYVVWLDTKDPGDAQDAEQDVINDLTADPGALGGVAAGDNGDPGAGDQGDSDDGSVVVAGGGTGGDSGGGTGGDSGGSDEGGGGIIGGGPGDSV